jgi:hypothetical protein
VSQQPTVGRTVHFHHNPMTASGPAAGPYAALVAAVDADGSLILAVVGWSHIFHKHDVRHRDDPARPVAADFWDWPPRA